MDEVFLDLFREFTSTNTKGAELIGLLPYLNTLAKQHDLPVEVLMHRNRIFLCQKDSNDKRTT